MAAQIVVAGALISASRLLVAQRERPRELAGLWELPGGKVIPGEGEAAALTRELREELAIEVTVGGRIGEDVLLSPAMILRAYRVDLVDGEPHAHDHRAVRFVDAAELRTLDWVPADRVWVPELEALLRGT
jgi:8-oxo-dGTP diphosphatase